MKRLKYLLVVLAAISLLFVSVSAVQKKINTTYTISIIAKDGTEQTQKQSGNINFSIDENTARVDIKAEIDGGYLGELEKNGGKLTVTVPLSIEGTSPTVKISVNGNSWITGLSYTISATPKDIEKGINVEVKAMEIDVESATNVTLSSLIVESEPTVTDTPEATATPTPTPTVSASPTPSPTPKETVNTNETTNDPYDSSKRVTNAPPTMSADLGIDEEDIATQAPEEPTASPEPTVSKFNSDPAFGLIILFVVLILLLAADIAIIIWRKKLGFWQLINGGVARRKIGEDLCDNPEDFIEADDMEQDFISNTPQEKNQVFEEKRAMEETDNSFDIDLNK